MITMMGRVVRVMILMAFGPSLFQVTCAQEEKAMPPRRLRVLAVGDSPPFQQEIRDGVRHEMEVAAGSIPPRSIKVVGEGVKEAELKMTLKRLSNAIVLPGAPVVAVLGAMESPWHRLSVPEGGDLLAVVWRDPKEGKWSKARSLFVKDDASFKAGQVRFVNVCPVEVALVLGKTRTVIKPGVTVIKDIGVTAGVPVKIAYATPKNGSWRRIYASVLVQNRGERGTVVIYRADGDRPRQPVKLVLLRESVPPPLKLERKRPVE
jgi:hypothetical protein